MHEPAAVMAAAVVVAAVTAEGLVAAIVDTAVGIQEGTPRALTQVMDSAGATVCQEVL